VLTVTVRTATGQQTYRITPSMRVLGRGGRPLDPAALRVGDILPRQGDTVQDESADAVTLIGQVAQVEATHGRHRVLGERIAARVPLGDHAVARVAECLGHAGVTVLPCRIPLESPAHSLRLFGHNDRHRCVVEAGSAALRALVGVAVAVGHIPIGQALLSAGALALRGLLTQIVQLALGQGSQDGQHDLASNGVGSVDALLCADEAGAQVLELMEALSLVGV
jgi:hypothetical protein